MSKPSPPATVIFDHNVDVETMLPSRLEDRWREVAPLNVIVRLKDGTTRLGRVCYFDSARLTLAQHGRLCDLSYKEIAHVLLATIAL